MPRRNNSKMPVYIPVDSTVRHKGTQKMLTFPYKLVWTAMLIVGVFVYGSYSVLVSLSKVGGLLPFNSSSVVLLIEGFKLLLSAIMYIPELKQTGFKIPVIPMLTVVSFSLPAILYTFNNNVALYMQVQMDPTTFQVLNNLKIATTALLYKLLINRNITITQWISLGLLMLAGIFDSYGGFSYGDIDDDHNQAFITIQGLIMMLVYCTISGFAAVYTEYILKQQKTTSLHLQNVLLYSYGVVFNGITSFCQIYSSEQDQDFFMGFSIYTWLIVVTQASNGLIMSVIMKHGSNLTRLFIISGAMIISTMLSVLIFGTVINMFFILALLMVTAAIYLYYN